MGWVIPLSPSKTPPISPRAHLPCQDDWNAFGCDVSENLLLSTAQKIVDYGLRDLGYHYIILDDCWSAGRDANGSLVANSTKFPSGMKAVGDALHAMGLGFGMYSSAGVYTCGQYGEIFPRSAFVIDGGLTSADSVAGSLGHEKQDAKSFAEWGVGKIPEAGCGGGFCS